MQDFDDLISMDLKQFSENMLLPDPDLYDYYSMAKNRVFYFTEEITENSLWLQRMILKINKEDLGEPVENRVPIKIFIDSLGGNIVEAMTLCQSIIMSKTPIYTINNGDASSGGCLLLLAGHKRFAMGFSTALIHLGSNCIEGSFSETKEIHKNYENRVKRIMDYILERTTIPQKTYNKNKNKEWYFSDKEQVEYGLVDKIIEDLDEVLL